MWVSMNVHACLHLKAKSCDRAKDYATAFKAAAAANEIGKLPFDPDLYAEQVSILIENWSAEAMPHFPRADCPSELPVFVAGMPRSGTSLIDQIIDAHPRAAGVGELSDLVGFATAMSTSYDPDLPAPACFGGYDDKALTRAAARYLQHCRKLSPTRYGARRQQGAREQPPRRPAGPAVPAHADHPRRARSTRRGDQLLHGRLQQPTLALVDPDRLGGQGMGAVAAA